VYRPPSGYFVGTSIAALWKFLKMSSITDSI
jgi:hypothetical protein